MARMSLYRIPRLALAAATITWFLPAVVGADLRGPFRASGLAFFVVHDGGPLRGVLRFTRPSTELPSGGIRMPHNAFWQLYDHEERLIRREYATFPGDGDRERLFPFELADARPGVYQIRCAQVGLLCELELDPPHPFGVMPCRARLHEGREGQFAETYLFVPRDRTSLKLRTYAAAVRVESLARELLGESGVNGGAVPVIPESVVRVRATFQTVRGAIGVTGVSPILCPDAETARRIRGSVEYAPDGRALAHRFQLRMWDWMHGVVPADLQVEPADLEPLAEHWLSDPRNAGLVGIDAPFNHIPYILRHQDVDPQSPTYGKGVVCSWLGPAFVIDDPLNPYRRSPAVLKRLLLYEFATFLNLKENGTFDGNDWNHYAGGDGLGFRKRAFQFGYVAPLVDPGLRALWTEAAVRVPSRWAFTRVSCENQTSHWLLDLYLLYMGTGDEIYRTLARDFAQAFYDPELNTFMQTGYQQERYGPDATYQGLSCAQQAIYYQYSRDSRALEGLKITYDLFNHTVAPEPDGRMIGASNFSHRTSGSWVKRQYNAGFRLMADELPEAGVWHPEYGNLGTLVEKAQERIRAGLTRNWDDAWYETNLRWLSSYAYHPWVSFYHTYLFPCKTWQAGGRWPVLKSDRFMENRNGEFLFVRRPGYYAAVYTGATSHEWVRSSRKPIPYGKGWEVQEGALVPTNASSRKTAWWPTQGLSLLWTPEAGTAVVGRNWNVYTANVVRIDRADGHVSWPDYWGFTSHWDAETGALRMEQPMVDLPFTTTRRLRFGEDSVAVDISLTGEVTALRDGAVEQIPYLQKEGLVRLFRTGEGAWVSGLAGPVTGAWLGKEAGPGMAILFPKLTALREGQSSRHYGQTMGLLEIPLPREENASLHYEYRSVDQAGLGSLAQ
ncbi:MAG: hypothetical protein HN742_39085 [Lentisphaerae bacterium]|jgi:hypothetical protein|nr:hypothetical protein [Lentisphaerota bacterium]MBT4819605.1 hypothetical protein [Lentisphaerota bacterium]MBT5607827.1 hypothetical protein [Lentisphaerota bacterium]MBT7059097.1 hypothetical protein [Lentisphaerota bacterium]MBT7847937.1 hypothetical protein [Lentisphaerota bacterium]